VSNCPPWNNWYLVVLFCKIWGSRHNGNEGYSLPGWDTEWETVHIPCHHISGGQTMLIIAVVQFNSRSIRMESDIWMWQKRYGKPQLRQFTGGNSNQALLVEPLLSFTSKSLSLNTHLINLLWFFFPPNISEQHRILLQLKLVGILTINLFLT
jgi:hypothetical protein